MEEDQAICSGRRRAGAWSKAGELGPHAEATCEPPIGKSRVILLGKDTGHSEGQMRVGISRDLVPKATAALAPGQPSPGTRWAGSSPSACTRYRSQLPPRKNSWRGQAPQTCPAGERHGESQLSPGLRQGRWGEDPEWGHPSSALDAGALPWQCQRESRWTPHPPHLPLTSWCSWWQARSVSSMGVSWSGRCR